VRLSALAGSLIAMLVAEPAFASCGFNAERLAFAGTDEQQAKCLLKPVLKWGRLGPARAQLPPNLSRLIGSPSNVDRGKLEALLEDAKIGPGFLSRPVSRARGGVSTAPLARYFVIHDTSSPWLGNQQFPADLDIDSRINNLGRYVGLNAVAHLFIDRRGRIVIGHDLSVPWRATKLEATAGIPSKGLFLHVENIQPRRRDPAGGPQNDAIAPFPGLSDAQYRSLALMYVAASARASKWLIPAFHAAIDEGISDSHDDPQNFDLDKFDSALGQLITRL